jgi:hypothetical protein
VYRYPTEERYTYSVLRGDQPVRPSGKRARHVLIKDEYWLPFKSYTTLRQIAAGDALEVLMESVVSHQKNAQALGAAIVEGLQALEARKTRKEGDD